MSIDINKLQSLSKIYNEVKQRFPELGNSFSQETLRIYLKNRIKYRFKCVNKIYKNLNSPKSKLERIIYVRKIMSLM